MGEDWYDVSFEFSVKGALDFPSGLDEVETLEEVSNALRYRDAQFYRYYGDIVTFIRLRADTFGGRTVSSILRRNFVEVSFRFGSEEGRQEFMEGIEEMYGVRPRNVKYSGFRGRG